MVYKTGVFQGTNSEPLDIYLLLSFQRQSLLVRNYFQFLIEQRFSNSNLRQISDFKSISVLIKSNIAFIRPFFSALWPSRAGILNSIKFDRTLAFQEFSPVTINPLLTLLIPNSKTVGILAFNNRGPLRVLSMDFWSYFTHPDKLCQYIKYI